MELIQKTTTIEVYLSINELNDHDAELLQKAREATNLAYAPYSKFHVGASGRMSNMGIAVAANQENGSYPVGMCAERALLANIASQYPNLHIETIAVCCYNLKQEASNDTPQAPCGMCRQGIFELEKRFQKPIRIIMSGLTGKVWIVNSVAELLPLTFIFQ